MGYILNKCTRLLGEQKPKAINEWSTHIGLKLELLDKSVTKGRHAMEANDLITVPHTAPASWYKIERKVLQ